MNLWDTHPLATGVHLFRVDYGYPEPHPTRTRGWQTLDLSRTQLPPPGDPQHRLLGYLAEHSEGGVVLRNADRLLAWGRLRGRRDGLGEVCAAARSRPVVLICRFPRHATALRGALEGAREPVSFRETPLDGSLPPLYRGSRLSDVRVRLHLELEWISALACARGDAALEQVGILLASGPKRGAAVASTLGITQGAARSYLQWMQDVALVRREGRLFDLAHPLMGSRFKDFAPLERESPSHSKPSRDDMSVD